MSLISLEEHDGERLDAHRLMQKHLEPHPNGIACPECGEELWDSNPMLMLTSIPAQLNIHCPECGYRGYRYM